MPTGASELRPHGLVATVLKTSSHSQLRTLRHASLGEHTHVSHALLEDTHALLEDTHA